MTLHFLSQAGPPLPDWSSLSGLPPGVMYGIIGTIVLSILAANFGGVIRERLSRKPDPPPSPPPLPSPSPAAALPQAVGTASETSAQFIEHLKQQLAAEEKDHAKTKAELETLRVEASQLQQMLWRRGPQ